MEMTLHSLSKEMFEKLRPVIANANLLTMGDEEYNTGYLKIETTRGEKLQITLFTENRKKGG